MKNDTAPLRDYAFCITMNNVKWAFVSIINGKIYIGCDGLMVGPWSTQHGLSANRYRFVDIVREGCGMLVDG